MRYSLRVGRGVTQPGSGDRCRLRHALVVPAETW